MQIVDEDGEAVEEQRGERLLSDDPGSLVAEEAEESCDEVGAAGRRVPGCEAEAGCRAQSREEAGSLGNGERGLPSGACGPGHEGRVRLAGGSNVVWGIARLTAEKPENTGNGTLGSGVLLGT